EGFYGQAAYQLADRLQLGVYYGVLHLDANDRSGDDRTRFPESWFAWQRDLAATIRYDFNDHWLWKLEAHFMDGAGDLDATANPAPDRYWGLFLFKTTV